MISKSKIIDRNFLPDGNTVYLRDFSYCEFLMIFDPLKPLKGPHMDLDPKIWLSYISLGTNQVTSK